MQDIKLAIPTKESRGIEDEVSDVFGRAKTFTIIDIKGNDVTNVEVIANPAASYKHGAGPVVIKTLIDMEVNAVVATEFGPGVLTLLEHFNVVKVQVGPNIRVVEAIKKFLE